ncbi:MAG: hypothetical protein K0S71_3124, partial [Clostridia bacterium]|nr:hypothetical protein [Clostridia bacterium]
FWGIGMFWGPLILNSYIEENSYSLGFYIFSEMLIIQAIVLFVSNFYPFQATKEVL